MKTASDVLSEAASLLELKTIIWNKGFFFQINPESIKGCSMCAHGAIAYCGNQKVRKLIDKGEVMAADLPMLEAARAGADAAVMALRRVSTTTKVNSSIPNWIENNVQYLAHYKAAKAGLTISYNDAPNTAKQDVINKLREAALL